MKLNPKMHLLDPLSADLKKAATRNAFGDALLELGEKDPEIVALCADVAGSVQIEKFGKKFPERFFQVGVAEQNMAAVAAGLAYAGKKPYIGAFAAFNPGRNWEQIRTTICYGDANVKIEGSHVGLEAGEDGATHQALEDISLTRCLPHMTVVVPCDYNEGVKAVKAAHEKTNPFYIRVSRGALPVFTTPETPFELGKLNLLNEGSDIAIIAIGDMVFESLCAAAELEKKGISVAVANMHTVSHPDAPALAKLARECGRVITVEDHQVKGGLGSAVCETLAEVCPVPVRRHGMQMKFGESGKGPEVLKKYGLDRIGIANIVEEEMRKKRGN